MTNMTCLCRTATTFIKDGGIDEEAQREFLQRFVDNKLGVYLASAGSGESHAMSKAEIKRVYEIGVAVGKGKIQVNANPPEQHTAKATREHTMIAIEAGIEVVNVYGPASWHGFKPTSDEYFAYYDDTLRGINHPIAIAPNPTIGYLPTPSQIAEVSNRHRQVVAINLSGCDTSYFLELKGEMKRNEVEIYVPFPDSFNTLKLGATGLVSMEGNILPKTFRRYIDAYEQGRYDEMAKLYGDIARFIRHVRKWQSSTPRWLKMAMAVLEVPGGKGGLREPYRMPNDAEVKKFTDGLYKLGLEEIEEIRTNLTH